MNRQSYVSVPIIRPHGEPEPAHSIWFCTAKFILIGAAGFTAVTDFIAIFVRFQRLARVQHGVSEYAAKIAVELICAVIRYRGRRVLNGIIYRLAFVSTL